MKLIPLNRPTRSGTASRSAIPSRPGCWLLAFSLLFLAAGSTTFAVNEVGDPNCSVVDVMQPNRLIDVNPGDEFWLTVPVESRITAVQVHREGDRGWTWLKAGEFLPVQYHDPGEYTIRLRQANGLALPPFTVRVIGGPAEAEQPHGHNGQAGAGGVQAMAAASGPSFNVGSVYAGDYVVGTNTVGKYPVRIVAFGIGDCTLTKYRDTNTWWTWTFTAADFVGTNSAEKGGVIDGPPAGTNTWTLVKSRGGTHVLSPNSPSRLKVMDLILTNDLGHAPAPGSVANLLWYALTNETVTLQVMPGPNWVTNNPAAAASLFDWTTNNVALPVTTNLTQTFFPAVGTNMVNVACHSPAPATPTNQTTTIIGVNVKISVDTNRDGVVDDNDEDGKNQWTIQRGAFVTVDQWMCGDLALVPEPNIETLAPVVLGAVGNLGDGWQVKVSALGICNPVLVSVDKKIKIGAGAPQFVTNANWLATAPVTLYAAVGLTRSGAENRNEMSVVVELFDPQGQKVAADEAKLKVAPIILPWNALTLERLYCTAGFPEDVCWPNHALPTKQKAYPLVDTRWVQDMMELGKSQFAGTSFLDQVVDLGSGSTYIEANLLPEGGPADNIQWHKNEWPNDGNGGNIEVFPPYTNTSGTNYPFGRVVMGSGMNKDLPYDAVVAQRIQDPIRVQLDWLAVGHVDEVFCFLRPTATLVADPALAWQEIIEMINDPVRPKTILVGIDKNWDDSLTDVTSDENFFFSQTKPLEQFLDVTPQSFTVTQGRYLKNDYLLIDREVLLVTNVTVAGGQTTLEVLRGQPFGNSGQSHTVGARIRKLSHEFVGNVYPIANSDFKRVNDLRTELQNKLATTVTGTSIPVVFGDVYEGTNYLGRCAASANMVNCVVDGADIYATDPGNARFRQLFQSFVSETVRWIDGLQHEAWNNYHQRDGELHCGSNAKRTFPNGPNDIWWTMTRYENWPNQP